MRSRKYIISTFLVLITIGCGYTPTAKLAEVVLGEKVYVETVMSRVDPQNTVIIRDSIAAALVDRYGITITDKNLADTTILATLLNTSFRAIAYDTNGYIVSYRATVRLKIEYQTKAGIKGSMTTQGNYDFPITANSVISDSKRFEAIKFASEDAVDEFLAVVAIRGLQSQK